MANEEYRVVGKPVERTDGRVKATGKARYAGDLVAPGMLHGKILRSPLAHARIVNIDTSAALRLPGVMAVITGRDFPGIPFGTRPDTRDQVPMPITKVHHFGEGVAAVAALDEETAEEALDLIKVDYEELPVVLTAEDALRPGAPLVNEFCKSNIAYTSDFMFGDPEEGFKAADYIKEEQFSSQRVAVGFIEPHACLAEVDATGRVLLQGSKQSPYPTWRHMCRALDLPLSKMRLVTPFVGGAFSGKHDPFDVDFAAVRLAQITNRPVKIVLNYDEVLAAYRQRNAMEATLKMGVKKRRQDHRPQGGMRARRRADRGHRAVQYLLLRGLAQPPLQGARHRVPRQAGLLQQGALRHGEGPGDRAGPVRGRLPARHRGRGPGHRPGRDTGAQRGNEQLDHGERRRGRCMRPARMHREIGRQPSAGRRAGSRGPRAGASASVARPTPRGCGWAATSDRRSS